MPKSDLSLDLSFYYAFKKNEHAAGVNEKL